MIHNFEPIKLRLPLRLPEGKEEEIVNALMLFLYEKADKGTQFSRNCNLMSAQHFA